TLSVNSLVAECIAQWGNDAQQKKFLPQLTRIEGLGAFAVTEPQAGSDVQAVRTRAERHGDHYVLNGEKVWISNASYVGLFLVIAATDPSKRTKGFSAFLIERGARGLSVGKSEPKMGQRASPACPVLFD